MSTFAMSRASLYAWASGLVPGAGIGPGLLLAPARTALGGASRC